MVPLTGPLPRARPVPASPTVPARLAPRSGQAPPTRRVMVSRTASTRMAPTEMAPAGTGSRLEQAPLESYVTARPSGPARPRPPPSA
jgi:hypothetical protein